MIPDDVDNRWNYTELMIEEAKAHKGALDDLVEENSVLRHLCLTKDHWKRLVDIRQVLEPFKRYTEQVSKKLPSIYLTIRKYFELNDILTKIVQRQGEYTSFDNKLISAIKEGKKKFDKYFDLIKANDTYYITSVLNPRVKTRVIQKYVYNVDKVIKRI